MLDLFIFKPIFMQMLKSHFFFYSSIKKKSYQKLAKIKQNKRQDDMTGYLDDHKENGNHFCTIALFIVDE